MKLGSVDSLIRGMEYPGRFIFVGLTRDGKESVVLYGLTGRSDSSRARRLVHDEGSDVVRTEVTDPEALMKGDPQLLIYQAIRPYLDVTVVSNGSQTNLVYNRARELGYERRKMTPKQILEECMRNPWFEYNSKLGRDMDITSFEPDEPNWTPRITGFLRDREAALFIARKDGVGTAGRECYGFELEPGIGRFIATYTGEDQEPLPSFGSNPVAAGLPMESPEDLAQAVYDALPTEGYDKDVRVGVAAMFTRLSTSERRTHTVNYHG